MQNRRRRNQATGQRSLAPPIKSPIKYFVGNEGGNKIQQDGFTVLATCSFRRLRKITASWSSTDKTDAVAALNLVAAKCPYPSKVECYFDFKLKKEINRILLSRFIQKEVE